jgi:capsular polysaccharide export protein
MPESHSASLVLQLPPHPQHVRVIARRTATSVMPRLSSEESAAIASRIARARVGGRFWTGRDPAALAALGGLDERVPMISCRAAALPPLLALCRARHPGARVAIIGAAGEAGADIVYLDDRSDPWPALDRLGTLYCDDPSTRLAALAALAGRPIVQMANGEADPVDSPALVRGIVTDLVGGWRYASPYDGGEWTLDALIDYLALWRRVAERTAGIEALVGISRWKRARTRQFLIGSPAARFVREPRKAARASGAGAIAIWPSRADEKALADRVDPARIWRIEDGFIRSTGLGAAFVRPSSLVLDTSGIYYDPRRPSDLELLLQNVEIPEAMQARGRALIAQIRQAGATKYNLKDGPAAVLPDNRKIVLVAGQVADDQSVLAAGGGVTMADMVMAARHENPDAFLVYKPHPDVVAKLRDGERGDAGISALADLILPGGDTHALLERADEVHVLSSLLGFEALLRGCRVVTHGRPFFAGWGLTDDRAPLARRNRSRTLDELAAAALILYPLYVDPDSGLPCSPEHLLSVVTRARPPSPMRMRLARGIAAVRKWTRTGSKRGFNP